MSLNRRGTFSCDDCASTSVVLWASEHGGWKVSCGNGHEVFPMTGTILVVRGDTSTATAQ